MANPIKSPYFYETGYIYLPVDLPLDILPEHLIVSDNSPSFIRKDKFHVSLVCPKVILEKLPEERQSDTEQKIVNIFAHYVKEYPIQLLSFKDEFRLAKRGEKQSVIIMCNTSNITELYKLLSIEIGQNIPIMPGHITLYTLQKNAGIGIRDDQELAETQIITNNELSLLRKTLENQIKRK
jgi:hypothetical protein